MKQLAIRPETCEIIDILPEEHKFSEREKALYVFDKVDDEKIEQMLAASGRTDLKLDAARNTGVLKVWNGSEWV